jgi:GNAT superfamily N-acetyltransferase
LIVSILQVDPFDPAAFDAWYATYAAADRAGREQWAKPWRLEEYRAEQQARVAHKWTAAYSLLVEGRVVTTAQVELPLLENLDLAGVRIHTHPDHRRLGYATRMLEHVEGLVRERGRTRLLTDTAYPYNAPADGAGQPGADFLTNRGFEFGLVEIMRVAELPVAEEILDRLGAQAEPHHTAYTLRSFEGPVPEELVQGFAEVTAALSTDAPVGSIEREPDIPNVDSLRAGEDTLAKMGRTKYNTVALDVAGDVAAYTELVVSREDPGAVYQWGTLVRRRHRGHRLGLAVKVANLRFLQRLRDDARLLTTYNAEVNSHMVQVNEQMGFRPVERLGQFQKRLP